MVWREEVGWQVEGMVYFGPNVVSFLLKLGASRWYISGAYATTNEVLVVHQVEQVLVKNSTEIEPILVVYLNTRLEEQINKREEDLVTDLSNHILEDACR